MYFVHIEARDMKYSTSPSTSRCTSPLTFQSGTTLPMPVTYRNNCMGAATKCYKYLRKLLKFDQMDFEFAMWQMIYLFVAPQKVYRNFQSRKQTKSQFARDDPAFLVLLLCWVCVSSIGFAVVFRLTFFQFIQFLLYVLFVDCIGVGLIVATVYWFVANRFLRVDPTQDVEWGYAFDIHLNAFFPPLVILHVIQLVLYNDAINHEAFSSCFVGNTFWLIAAIYYIYITFLGYACLRILCKTHIILLTLPAAILIYILTISMGVDISRLVMTFYRKRVI